MDGRGIMEDGGVDVGEEDGAGAEDAEGAGVEAGVGDVADIKAIGAKAEEVDITVTTVGEAAAEKEVDITIATVGEAVAAKEELELEPDTTTDTSRGADRRHGRIVGGRKHHRLINWQDVVGYRLR